MHGTIFPSIPSRSNPGRRVQQIMIIGMEPPTHSNNTTRWYCCCTRSVASSCSFVVYLSVLVGLHRIVCVGITLSHPTARNTNKHDLVAAVPYETGRKHRNTAGTQRNPYHIRTVRSCSCCILENTTFFFTQQEATFISE
jgi:hypothetical protein